ncbi:ImmA/IrrE family metallo-endopeptidase [Sphingobacterium mizutaii]|uniref:ImmA/IrrE family metallo-endopeptidase n=1 Tax=Sphingobacterium mizutaii TaxID=1010 RepID=UPI001627FA02|nr:ImmA/IrrE family metallo-endopeptidase [Sphingobacterium mizutaii]
MNTVSKGELLEVKVYELFKQILSDGSYYLNDKSSTVYSKKGYYSTKRQKDIIFDVSIETFIGNSPEYSLLTLIECKNLNKSVSVDDVEEFSKKISQVGEHNTKGIIITTIGFQEAALNVAKAEKIGMAKMPINDSLKWISFRKSKNTKLSEKSLHSNSIEYPCALLNEGYITESIIEFLIQISVIDRPKNEHNDIFIPYVDDKKINYIIDKLLTYDIYKNQSLNFDKLTKLMNERYGVTFEYDVTDSIDYLGKIEFNPLVIKISKHARVDTNRWRFTLAHEIGHLILHSKILGNHINSIVDNEETLSIKYFNEKKNINRMELQANLFASTLLLPDKLLYEQVAILFIKYNISRGRMYLDNQPINQHEVYKILYRLSSIFEVSIESIKIRLIKLNLLIDVTDQRLSTLIRNYYKEMINKK